MSFRALVLKRSHLLIILAGLLAAPAAFGQVANSPMAFVNQDAITTSFVSAPNLSSNLSGGGGGNTGGNNQWLRIQFHYGTTPNMKTAFLDSVEFKVWVEGFDQYAKNAPPGAKGVAVALTGSVTYVNVAAAKDLYGVLYIHPSTLARYSDDRGYEQFDRKYDIHVEAFVDGAMVDYSNKAKEADPLGWFKQFTVVPNLVYRPDQTPFIIADPDFCPAVKLPAPTP